MTPTAATSCSRLMQVVLAARAGGLDVLDGVYNDFRDLEGFAGEVRAGRGRWGSTARR